MSLWKKLFGTSKTPEDPDVDIYAEVSTSPETRQIETLVNKAHAFYPHGDPKKALALFRQAIRLIGPAPASKSAQEILDLSAIGDAFWMAWVCLDLLDRPEEETKALLAEARTKSPVTAARIEKCLDEAQQKAAPERELKDALALLRDTRAHDPTRLQNALAALRAAGAWWDLRDSGIALVKAGKNNLVWQALNSALSIALAKTGNVPSIYLAMGDFWKAQERHQEAARYYLLSCLGTQTQPLKRAVDQLRISLKKAGVSGDPTAIRDDLLAMARKENERAVLARLDGYFSSTKNVQ